MVEIDNVRRANSVLNYILERTRSETVGLGLFYGRPGLGKTRWARRIAISKGYIYVSLVENMTLKDFLKKLIILLKYKEAIATDISGTQSYLYDSILECLQHHPGLVLLIDEIDYAFSKKRILATIRDFVDHSDVTIIMLGMHDAKSQLLKFNSHYFDRCNGFYEFIPLSEVDVSKVLAGVCVVSVDKETVSYITQKSSGTLRLVNKYIQAIEKAGMSLGKRSLDYRCLKKILGAINN